MSLVFIFKDDIGKSTKAQIASILNNKEIVIIGVEPKEMDCGLELTEPVKQRLAEIVNMVLEEIKDAVHGR